MKSLYCQRKEKTKEIQTLTSYRNIGTDMTNRMLHAWIFINLIRGNANVIVLQFLVHLEASSAMTVQTATSKYIYTIKFNNMYAADLVTS
jgi:hypothetical protein